MSRQEGAVVIIQIVKASIKPEHRERWREVIARNAADTRAERGCEGYAVTENLEHPNSFVIVEWWTDMPSIEEHLRNQFGKLMAALGDVFAAPPEAAFYEVSSTLMLDEVLQRAGVAG
jgi:quinol monooxygenase YgiN